MTSGEFYRNDVNRETMSDRAIKSMAKWGSESARQLPSGREVITQAISTLFFDMDGNLLGALSVMIDLTEIRNQQSRIEGQNIRINKAALEGGDISRNLSSSADELASQIESATRGSSVQRDRAAETVTAMARAREGLHTVEQVINSVEAVRHQAESLKNSMERLSLQAEDIGNILNVINEISDQTNLLALKAAIEAEQ